MITKHLIVSGILIAGGCFLCLPGIFKTNTPMLRGFARAMRVFGLAGILGALLNIFSHSTDFTANLSTHQQTVLKVVKDETLGLAVGIVLSLIVSGHWSSYFAAVKELKKSHAASPH